MANLRDLHGRVHSGRYRARPSRRAYIPKADGRLRPSAAPPGFAVPAQAVARHGITIVAPLTQPWGLLPFPASGRRLHVAG